MISSQIFEDLQSKIDEDAAVREQIRTILNTLERQERSAQSALSRAHSTPIAQRQSQTPPPTHTALTKFPVQPVIQAAEAAIKEEIETIGTLSNLASGFPYYK